MRLPNTPYWGRARVNRLKPPVLTSGCLIALLSLLCAVLPTTGLAQTTQSLSRWIKHDAAPELAQTMAQHPKFKGESLRFGMLISQKPTHANNKLANNIIQELVHQVLRKGRNDVLTRVSDCNFMGDATYFIGVSLTSINSSRHRVHLRAMDTKSKRWVSGISLAWEGRLSSTEKRALAEITRTPKPGSAERPLASLQDPRLEKTLSEQLDCARVARIPGTIGVGRSDGAAEIAKAASNHLGIATTAEHPDWLLTVSRQTVHPLDVYTVRLTSKANYPSRTVAEIHVKQRIQQPRTVTIPPVTEFQTSALPDEPVAGARETQVVDAGRLLGPVHRAKPRECRDCITFQLKADAYVVAFSTIEGRVILPSCDTPMRWREKDRYQFRIKEQAAPVLASRPSYGFYAVASTDATVAADIAHTLTATAGHCGGSPDMLPALLTRFDNAGQQIDWRAFHAGPPGG